MDAEVRLRSIAPSNDRSPRRRRTAAFWLKAPRGAERPAGLRATLRLEGCRFALCGHACAIAPRVRRCRSRHRAHDSPFRASRTHARAAATSLRLAPCIPPRLSRTSSKATRACCSIQRSPRRTRTPGAGMVSGFLAMFCLLCSPTTSELSPSLPPSHCSQCSRTPVRVAGFFASAGRGG